MTFEPRIIGNLPSDNQNLIDIVDAMHKWTVIEFLYYTKEKIKTYFCIAPLGLKEIDGKWYLFGFDREDRLRIFRYDEHNGRRHRPLLGDLQLAGDSELRTNRNPIFFTGTGRINYGKGDSEQEYPDTDVIVC